MSSSNYRLQCAACDTTYLPGQAHGWWHFDHYNGPAPFQGPQAKNPSFTGLLCGPCSDKHVYASQCAFEAFVKLHALTQKLTA